MPGKRHRKHRRHERNSHNSSSSEGDGCDSDSDPSGDSSPGSRDPPPCGPQSKNFAQAEFNKNRKIIIRNIPPVKYEVRVLELHIPMCGMFSVNK